MLLLASGGMALWMAVPLLLVMVVIGCLCERHERKLRDQEDE